MKLYILIWRIKIKPLKENVVVETSSSEKLEIGDSTVIKEWTFAGDVVKGIWQLIQQDLVFEANIGSGKGYSIEEYLSVCFTIIHKD